MSGFSFCGKHCGEQKLGFNPNESSLFPHAPDFEPIEETVTNYPGGYDYGDQIKIREFSLACYFEDVTKAELEKVIQWFYRGKKGKQIFDDRPFVYYTARLSKIIEGKTYFHFDPEVNDQVVSGTMTLKFKAYDPFGKMLYSSIDGEDHDHAADYCGILKTEDMPDSPSLDPGEFLAYNPGTEYSYPIIRIAGTAPNGQTITNHTTGDECRILGLPSDPDYQEIDCGSGSVKQLPSAPDEYAFIYHDLGYISLAPCIPYDRNIIAEYTAGSNEVQIHGQDLGQEDIGRYIHIAGQWVRIIYINNTARAVINKNMDTTGREETMIAVMNQISISGEDIQLTKVEIEYVPQIY